MRIAGLKSEIRSLQIQQEERRGGREAEGSCLLSSCGGNSTPGSNPGLSASLTTGAAQRVLANIKSLREEVTMQKNVVAFIVALAVVVSFGACKKKEEKPQLPPGHPTMEGGMPPAGMPQAGMPNMQKMERTTIVPKEVAAKWKSVKLRIENKAAKTTSEYTVNVGSDLAIPGTNMSVKVLSFLPDFKMTDKEITSASDKPNMPAARVAVTESGKEIWNNWLFSLQPQIHPFQHPNIGITLVGGVSK